MNGRRKFEIYEIVDFARRSEMLFYFNDVKKMKINSVLEPVPFSNLFVSGGTRIYGGGVGDGMQMALEPFSVTINLCFSLVRRIHPIRCLRI